MNARNPALFILFIGLAGEIASCGDLQSVLADALKSQRIPGLQACVIDGAGREWNVSAGFADKGRQFPVQETDIFRVGSVTKIYTACVIHRLVEQSLLDLSMTLDRWHPDYPNASEISLRDLLSHRSGIPDVLSFPRFFLSSTLFPRTAWKTQDLIAAIGFSRKEGFGKPGAGFSYSNTNYILLGEIAEKVTGMSLNALYSEYLLRPSGFASTFFLPVQPTPRPLRSGFDRSLIPFPWGYEHTPDCVSWDTLSNASGAMAANARELALFLHYLFDGRIVREDTLTQMRSFSPCKFPDGPEIDGVGLGLFRFHLDGREYWGHEGLMIGSQSIVLHCPVTGLTMALIGNSSRFSLIKIAKVVDLTAGGKGDFGLPVDSR